MRLLVLMPLALGLLAASAADTALKPPTPCPFWDGQETVAEYAQRANLPPIETLDLGNGVTMELMLIPAGPFLLGTPLTTLVDEGHYAAQIKIGQTGLAMSAAVLLVLLGFVIARAIREKHRPQVSLARLLIMALVAGTGLLGGLHWRYSLKELSEARTEYAAAVVRYEKADASEKPAREVTISAPFYLGKYEVTQEQYEAVTGENPSYNKGRDIPVNKVSWHDAQAFCSRVSVLTSETARLPRDAEWERACRAGTRTVYYTGDTQADLDRAGWTYTNRGKIEGIKVRHPLVVGQKMPNAWGLYDMHGNVDEWCEDLMENSNWSVQCHMVRGGSSHCDTNCRSAHRWGFPPDRRTSYTGFRVVVEVPAPQSR